MKIINHYVKDTSGHRILVRGGGFFRNKTFFKELRTKLKKKGTHKAQIKCIPKDSTHPTLNIFCTFVPFFGPFVPDFVVLFHYFLLTLLIQMSILFNIEDLFPILKFCSIT